MKDLIRESKAINYFNAIVDIKIKEGVEAPEWLESLVNSDMLNYKQNYSKYVTAASVF